MSSSDVIILGGGPAGMSALLWCHSLNLSGLLLERSLDLGGQMLQMHHRIMDYPGLFGLTGQEMRYQFVEHLNELKLAWRAGCRIEGLDPATRSLLCDGERLQAPALIVATGARKRTLGVPGEEEFAARGVSFSGTRDHSLYAGKRVCVIGGGDSAIENSLILSRVCPSVTLIHRSDRFRARQSWLAAAQNTPSIRFLPNTELVRIEGDKTVNRIMVREKVTGEEKPIETDAVFIKIGIAPNTESFAGRLAMDAEGYLQVDRRQRTSVEGVYAIGDVTRPVCFSIAAAVGQGAIAVKEIAETQRSATASSSLRSLA